MKDPDILLLGRAPWAGTGAKCVDCNNPHPIGDKGCRMYCTTVMLKVMAHFTKVLSPLPLQLFLGTFYRIG